MEKIFPDMKPHASLDSYIQSNLRPTVQELSRFHAAVDQFVRFLQQKFSEPPFTVSKVLKSNGDPGFLFVKYVLLSRLFSDNIVSFGDTVLSWHEGHSVQSGSLGKATAVRGGSDIDLVVFVNGLHSIDDLKEHREKLIERLIETAKAYPKFQSLHLKAGKPTKYAAKFALGDVEIDVLPAFDALSAYSGKPRNIYRCMFNHFLSNVKIGQEFSASLAPLQVRFIKYLRGDVKDIIRLVKQWKRENELEIPSYCLELLTVKVWRDMGGTRKCPRPAPTEEIFKNIILKLADFHNIQVAFGTYYSVEGYSKILDSKELTLTHNEEGSSLPSLHIRRRTRSKIKTRSQKSPYILDPANPNNNTLSRLTSEQIEDIVAAATEASDILQKI